LTYLLSSIQAVSTAFSFRFKISIYQLASDTVHIPEYSTIFAVNYFSKKNCSHLLSLYGPLMSDLCIVLPGRVGRAYKIDIIKCVTGGTEQENSARLTNQRVSDAFTSSPFSIYVRHILPASKFQHSYFTFFYISDF